MCVFSWLCLSPFLVSGRPSAHPPKGSFSCWFSTYPLQRPQFFPCTWTYSPQVLIHYFLECMCASPLFLLWEGITYIEASTPCCLEELQFLSNLQGYSSLCEPFCREVLVGVYSSELEFCYFLRTFLSQWLVISALVQMSQAGELNEADPWILMELLQERQSIISEAKEFAFFCYDILDYLFWGNPEHMRENKQPCGESSMARNGVLVPTTTRKWGLLTATYRGHEGRESFMWPRSGP